MELSDIRQKRTELEQAIILLISNFIKETDVEISDIRLQPAVFARDSVSSGYVAVTPATVEVELEI